MTQQGSLFQWLKPPKFSASPRAPLHTNFGERAFSPKESECFALVSDVSSLVQNYAEHSAFPTSQTNKPKQKAAQLPERLNGVTMTLSLPSLSALVAQADLNQLVSRHTPSVRTSCNVTHYQCPNPAHEDRNPSFTVTTTRQGKQIARCFSQCAWQGDALDFLKWHEGLTTHEAGVQLRNQFGKSSESSFEASTSTPRKNVLSLLPKLQEASKKENSIDDEAFLA